MSSIQRYQGHQVSIPERDYRWFQRNSNRGCELKPNIEFQSLKGIIGDFNSSKYSIKVNRFRFQSLKGIIGDFNSG